MSTVRAQFAAFTELQIAAPTTTPAQRDAFAASLDALDDILAGRVSAYTARKVIADKEAGKS